MAAAIAGRGRWRDEPYEDLTGPDGIDPRTLTIALDDLLPAERTVAVDSGNFMGYPSAYLRVPDEHGLLLHPGLPVDRAGPGHRDRRRDAPGRTGWPSPRWGTAAR